MKEKPINKASSEKRELHIVYFSVAILESEERKKMLIWPLPVPLNLHVRKTYWKNWVEDNQLKSIKDWVVFNGTEIILVSKNDP